MCTCLYLTGKIWLAIILVSAVSVGISWSRVLFEPEEMTYVQWATVITILVFVVFFLCRCVFMNYE